MMMVENQESRFVCKFCNKKYPCGKSLGGHIKCHALANSAESELKKLAIDDDPKPSELEKGQCQSGYGLRENPRKTRRAVDSKLPSSPLKRVCKQCGRAFESLKALSGHMACHSDKDKGLKTDCLRTGEDDKVAYDSCSDSEEAEELEIQTRASSKIISGSSSASEINVPKQEDFLALCLMMLSRDPMKDWMSSVVVSSDNNSIVMEAKPTSAELITAKKISIVENCEITEAAPQVKNRDEEKLKGIAFDDEAMDSDAEYFLCLRSSKTESDVSFDGLRMNDTLSKYKKHCISTKERIRKGFKSGKTEFSRKPSTKHEYDDEGNSGVMASESRKRKSDADILDNPSSKKSKYECFNCKKTFKSFQALGGHRPCHKRTNSYYESRYESDENSLEDYSDDYMTNNTENAASASNKKPKGSPSSQCEAKKRAKSKKNNKPHTCPYCNRVFKNGQAFGGHKRSHFLGGNNEEEIIDDIKPEIQDLLDLNLPAPEVCDADDGDRHFFSR